MGLLDDAIREHLELKRRHGADPSEVARQEHEALGPVRRTDALEVPDEPVGSGAAPVAEAPEARAAGAPVYEDEYVAADEYEEEPVREDERPAEHPVQDAGQPTVAFSLDEQDEHERPARPTPAAPQPPAPPEDRPRAAPPADVVPADDEPGEDDELAETPEFLQETPEHDRLWFEQKPPRDFDF
jgi:hypothetical protein